MHYLIYGGMGLAFVYGVIHIKDGRRFISYAALILAGITLFMSGCAQQAAPMPVVLAAPPPPPYVPPDPYAGLSPDVAAAIRNGQTPTLKHGITWVQPYSPDLQYPLCSQMLHTLEIRLRDDEWTDKKHVRIGDVKAWGTIVEEHSVLVFPTVSNIPITVPGVQVAYPADPNIVTNLVIHTTMGNDYTFNPVKICKPFTERVQFYYPEWTRQQDARRKQALQEAKQ